MKINEFKTYSRKEALDLVPILTARQVPATVSGSELQRLAVRAAIRKFNEKMEDER